MELIQSATVTKLNWRNEQVTAHSVFTHAGRSKETVKNVMKISYLI